MFIKNEKNSEKEILRAHMLINANFGPPMYRLRLKRIPVSKKNIAVQFPFVDNSKASDVIFPNASQCC
jgi:hypothetical protein